MSKDLLDDDFDWEKIYDDIDDDFSPQKRQSVVMIRTFNTEEQAHLAVAILRAENVDVHIVAATTGLLTPFAYGNVRLFVSEDQVEKAVTVLDSLNIKQEAHSPLHFSTVWILVILIVGIFIIGLFVKLLLLKVNF